MEEGRRGAREEKMALDEVGQWGSTLGRKAMAAGTSEEGATERGNGRELDQLLRAVERT